MQRDGVRRRLLPLAMLAAIGCFAAPAAHAADKVVKIGMLGQINAGGGVAGYKFELVVGDVKDGAAGDVTSAVERMLGDADIHFMLTGLPA